MNIISLPRGQGKTTQLVKMSAETGIRILVGNDANAEIIRQRAKELNLKIKNPIVIQKNRPTELLKDICGANKFYVDELPMVISNLLGGETVEIATLTETNTDKNSIIRVFSESLNTLLIKYNKMISNGNEGGALNTLKNIEMLIRIIKDIQENKEFKNVLDDLSIIWGQIDNQDEIAEKLVDKEVKIVTSYGDEL